MKGYWVQPKRERHEMRLFDPTLDDMIPGDHPVRQLDALLDRLDWSPWEARYPSRRGRPPFHPRVIASAILYGLLTGERSSREPGRACYGRLDFLWLLRGLTAGHCVFAAFRRNFGEELKDLNRQITRKALELSLDKMLELALDGTHLRASASKDSCKSAAALESLLTELDQRMEEALAESAARDEATGAALEELAKAREAATEEEQREGEKSVENQAKSADHEDDDQGSQGAERAERAGRGRRGKLPGR
jgi:transposase